MKEHNHSDKLVKEVKELTDLFEIAKTVVSTLDIDKVLSSILHSAMEIAVTPSGSIALYNESKNEMEISAAEGFSKKFVSKNRWTVKTGGLTDKILSNKYPLVIDDSDRIKYFNNPMVKAEGIKSLVAAPLIFHDKVVGILYVDDFRKRKFQKGALKLLSILTSFAAMAIDNARLHKETFKLAISDGLTGLYNHRYFQEVLDDEIARSKRYNLYSSLIMLDIDNFKALNDTYGHQAGDKILTDVANCILKSIREVDCAARYGGEEFAIILPEIDIDSAFVVAERIRKNVSALTSTYTDLNISQISVTVGIASYPIDALDKEELIRRSDEALYHGKNKGKNCSVRFDKLDEASKHSKKQSAISDFKK